jgi:hypothetical protein
MGCLSLDVSCVNLLLSQQSEPSPILRHGELHAYCMRSGQLERSRPMEMCRRRAIQHHLCGGYKEERCELARNAEECKEEAHIPNIGERSTLGV